ncbi:MAG TPA: cell division protein ZapE [Spirochaetes bacterium]|nr:cell division protein ZapE [Spirochaetota bacterium]
MTTEKAIIEKKGGQKFCSFCDYTGIVRNPYFKEMGDVPLSPCPKCVQAHCVCGGVDPYYYFENDEIKDCHCREIRMKIDRINAIYQNSGIDRKYRWRFFDTYDSISKMSSDAKSAAYDLVKKFPKVGKGLYLWGNPGTGKTLLSSIILTELIIRHAIDGRFIKISRTFFNRLRETFNEGSATYGESGRILHELENVDVLVVDDFGVQRDSAWEIETLYNLVDARYEAEKFTIFTSNNDPFKALKELSGGRILSRIKEMCTIMEVSGQDYRDRL